MKIFRIFSPDEFLRICLVFEAGMEEDNLRYGHSYGKMEIERLRDIVYSNNADAIFSSLYIWVAFDGGVPLSFIMYNEIFQFFGYKRVCSEIHWISRDKSSGFRLLKHSLKELKKSGFDYVMLSSIENHPVAQKLRTIYKKIGFKKESETYIKKL